MMALLQYVVCRSEVEFRTFAFFPSLLPPYVPERLPFRAVERAGGCAESESKHRSCGVDVAYASPLDVLRVDITIPLLLQC